MDKYNQRWVMWFRPNKSWTRNAVTIGQTTYYSCPERDVDAAWRKHEEVHKSQWAREGFILFPIKYLWYSLRRGYEDNPYEQEANKG